MSSPSANTGRRVARGSDGSERSRLKLTKPVMWAVPNNFLPSVTNPSPQEAKIHLFRNLFRGREDVYPKRFESLKTGKKGYQPVCRNEWVSGICEKPRIRCDDCAHRELRPVTDDVVRNHLLGMDPQASSGRDYTIGVYPMLPDETCWFLAADFDKASWQQDAGAFLETCKLFDVPAALERSRFVTARDRHFVRFDRLRQNCCSGLLDCSTQSEHAGRGSSPPIARLVG